jgi:hypothetical protein
MKMIELLKEDRKQINSFVSRGKVERKEENGERRRR